MLSKKERVQRLKAKIQDLISRFPAHSLKPSMMDELEQLEEELALLEKEIQMNHKFDPTKKDKLHAPERYRLLPPRETLIKLDIKGGQILADIGCGTGFFTLPAAEVIGSQGLVYGLDISSEMLSGAEEKMAAVLVEKGLGDADNLAPVVFKKTQENQLPLEDDSVDIAFLALVLHELDNPFDFFKEIRRVLKPQGRVIVVEWKKELTQMGPPQGERLSPQEVGEIFAAAGFLINQQLELSSAHYGISGLLKESTV